MIVQQEYSLPAWWPTAAAHHRYLTLALGVSLFIIGYCAAFYISGSRMGILPSPLWIPDSILLCALLRARPSYWWIFLLLIVPIRLIENPAPRPLWYLLGTIGVDAITAVASACAVRFIARDPSRLSSFQDWLAIAAILAIAAASAFPGAALRHAVGQNYWLAWQLWFVGDALAQLTFTPAILTWLFWKPLPASRISVASAIEASVLLTGLLVTTYLTYYSHSNLLNFVDSRFFLPIPFLYWAALRFGVAGASIAVPVLALFAINSDLLRQSIHILQQSVIFGAQPPEEVFILPRFLLLRGLPVYVVAGLVEQRYRMERSLRESEARFRSIANTSPVLLWISGPDKLCQFVNQSWLNFTGRPLEAELGFGWAEGIHPDDREHSLQTYDDAFHSRRPFRMEYRLRHHSGQYRWIMDMGVPRFDMNNAFCGYAGSAMDITDQRQVQEHMAHLGQLERLAQLGEFSASIAHELRQPLAAISLHVGAAKLLLRASGASLPDIEDVMTDIEKDCTRADAVMASIRDFARKSDQEFESVDINAILRNCRPLIASEASRRSVKIEMHLADDLPSVRCIPTQIMQVILNLAANAIDAMELTLRADRVLTLRTERREKDVLVSVLDRGHGIRPEDGEKLFKSFFTTRPGGMGLGLAIVSSILQAHNGRAWAENLAIGGAAFHFTLPAPGEPRNSL
jgi:PAS domain S-box-containing protein